jgi:hypothetical protein
VERHRHLLFSGPLCGLCGLRGKVAGHTPVEPALELGGQI